MDYSRKDSVTDVIKVEGGCTTNQVFNNSADDSVQPHKGEPLTDEEWMSCCNKERIAKKSA